jgi:hypothetical protein
MFSVSDKDTPFRFAMCVSLSALGQVFSECFCFPLPVQSTKLHTHLRLNTTLYQVNRAMCGSLHTKHCYFGCLGALGRKVTALLVSVFR